MQRIHRMSKENSQINQETSQRSLITRMKWKQVLSKTIRRREMRSIKTANTLRIRILIKRKKNMIL